MTTHAVRCAIACFALAGCSTSVPITAGVDAAAPELDAGEGVFPDASADVRPCQGLECQIARCDNGTPTTLTGTVFDPAGEVGLYGVYVYVPNAPLAPIDSGVGSASCTSCQAPASGSPIVATSTDTLGHFKLENVPAGTDIPLVMQLGKWRRKLILPSVTPCVSADVTDKTRTRLPRKQHEGSPDDNLPLIGFTSGYDQAECFFLRRIGIDESEFTSPSGGGRVHVYKSDNVTTNDFPNGSGSANALWDTASEMAKYDMIFDACEGGAFTRGVNGYANMKSYLDGGGRAFMTHFFYNFFANAAQCNAPEACNGPPDFSGVGDWLASSHLPDDKTHCPNIDSGPVQVNKRCLQIDTGFPKGKAFSDWYKANNGKINPLYGGGEQTGWAGLTDTREDFHMLAKPLFAAGKAAVWLYSGQLSHTSPTPNDYDAYYFSFNTPVAAIPTAQCGKAIFSDVHLSGDPQPGNNVFPAYCAATANASDHAPNELALEFLFFDLASCVQDDRQPPIPPPVK